MDAVVVTSFKSLQQCLKNDLSPVARDCHSDLSAYAFLAPVEDKIVGEGLQAGAFAVRKGPIFRPVIDVRASAAGSGDRIGRALGV